jgi:hypothetical protein
MTAASQLATVVPNHESSQWLRERFRSGPNSWCSHVTLPLDPATTPVLLTLWDGYLTCGRCPVSPGRQTCDRCGRFCSDEPDQRIRFAELLVGLVVVAFGLCPACAAREFPL